MTDVYYAIFRVGNKKIRSYGDVKRLKWHMERLQETPNANPAETCNNKILIGGDSAPEILLQNHLSNVSKIRKNNVLATELMLTASHGFFFQSTDKDKFVRDFTNQALSFLREIFGTSCFYAILHLDEATPHIHALVSHKVKDKHGDIILANSRLFDGKEKLRHLQDEYAMKMSKLGLCRGVKYSKVNHIDIQKFYTIFNNDKEIDVLNQMVSTGINHKYVKDQVALYIQKVYYYAEIGAIPKTYVYAIVDPLCKLCDLVSNRNKKYQKAKEQNFINQIQDSICVPFIETKVRDDLLNNLDTTLDDIMKHEKDGLKIVYAGINAENNLKDRMTRLVELNNDLKRIKAEFYSDKGELAKQQNENKQLLESNQVLKETIKSISKYYGLSREEVTEFIQDGITALEHREEKELIKSGSN